MVFDHPTAEPFKRVQERFGGVKTANDDEVASISLEDVLDGITKRPSVLDYLAEVGIVVSSLDDLMLINDMADEEELSAHRVSEGIALATASQGEWILVRP